jgi:hypothetical protein
MKYIWRKKGNGFGKGEEEDFCEKSVKNFNL